MRALFFDISITILIYKTVVQTFPYSIILCNYFTDFYKLIKFYDVYCKGVTIKPTRSDKISLDES